MSSKDSEEELSEAMDTVYGYNTFIFLNSFSIQLYSFCRLLFLKLTLRKMIVLIADILTDHCDRKNNINNGSVPCNHVTRTLEHKWYAAIINVISYKYQPTSAVRKVYKYNHLSSIGTLQPTIQSKHTNILHDTTCRNKYVEIINRNITSPTSKLW